MYLKSLEIRGFKSFPDKTKLVFDPGITAVVGPNGSGKSNIADAVRWVLGEQSIKSLRGGRMEDVIFGGTQKRGSVGFAQVAITVDNSDHILDMDADEVIISRKYYRSGESEYRINQNTVRLRDIHEMLMDTGLGRDGYSMIGQGKIAEIVSAKSTERREIFEEAAGISKYRYRKEHSERQLELAKENLIRLKDIIVEIEGRLEPLRVQSEKAQKFVQLMNEKKQLEVSIFVRNLDEIKETIREHQNKLMVYRSDYDETEERLLGIERATEHIYVEIGEIGVQIEGYQEEKAGINDAVNKNVSEIAVLANDVFHEQENIKRMELEISASRDNSDDIDAQVLDKNREREKICQKLVCIDAEIDKLEKELTELINSSKHHSDEINSLTQRLNSLTEELSEATVEHVTSISSVSEIRNHIETVGKSMELRQGRLLDMEKEHEELRKYSYELSQQIVSDKNTLGGYTMKLSGKQKKYFQMGDNLSKEKLVNREISQRIKLLMDMEDNMEDFSYSVKNVMKMSKQGELDGVHGPVSKLLNVPTEYALAVETALSGGIQNIVVDNEEVAKRAINLLKQRKSGRATFLPLTSVRGNRINISSFRSSEGLIGVVSELVETDTKYSGVVDYLLGRTLLYENLHYGVEEAKRQGYKFRIVTLDGQIINAGGSLTGGSAKKSAGLLTRRNDILALQQKQKRHSETVEEMEAQYVVMGKEVAELEALCSGWSASVKTLEEDKLKCDFRLESVVSGIADTKKQIEQHETDINTSSQRIDELNLKTEASHRLKSDLQMEIEKIQSRMETEDIGRESLKSSMDVLTSQINSEKIDKMAYQKDVVSIEQFVRELESRKLTESDRLCDIRDEISKCREAVETLVKLSKQKERENADMKLQSSVIDRTIVDLNNKRQSLENSIQDTRQEEKELLSHKETVSKNMVRLQERVASYDQEHDQIVGMLWDEYEMTVSEGVKFAHTIDNSVQSKNELLKIKSNIRALGSVNVDSIEEYSEVKERYEYLTRQYDDVDGSKNRLIKLINDLTGTMQEIFAQSFREINRNFGEIFRELFGGGEARLELTDNEDILNCGINIFVQPPGKIIKNLSSLSGGEQSFVAIAIYFAILKVRPAPFCILDEIEAALDDVNVSKYAAYLRKMTNKTQFIAISHRRGTMEEADALYGVTMQEEGISKLLRLQLNEAVKTLE